MPPRRMNRRRRPAKKTARRSKVANVRDVASCSVVRTLVPGVGNQVFSFDNVNLADYDRAVQIAKAYQRYKITGIKVTWKPAFDTYSSATPQQKPMLYFIIDKSSSLPDNVTLAGLKSAGARPRALDEKPLMVSWKPAILSDNLAAAGGAIASGYKVSPILSTNANPTAPGVWTPSTIAHGGLKWYVECPGALQNFNMEMEVQFEFFKPMFPTLSASPARGIEYAVLDASPDGVEGGTDGITIPLSGLTAF